MYSERKSVTLLDGTVLENSKDGFPPLQEVKKVFRACEICPVRPICKDHNEFKCIVYGMFVGFWVGLDDALEFLENNTVTPSNSNCTRKGAKAAPSGE